MSNPIINLILLLCASVLLLIGAIQDLKTREVVDWVWILMILCGSLLNLVQVFLFIFEGLNPVNFLSSWIGNIIMALILGLLLTLTGMGGEADRIAFIAIAFITPVQQPLFLNTDPQISLILSSIPKIIGTFFNSYLLGISIPIILFCYNSIKKSASNKNSMLIINSVWMKLSLYFVGYPRSTKNLRKELKTKPWHFDFLEEYTEDSGWKFNFRMRLDTPEVDLARKYQIVTHLETFKKEVVWVQPSLPFIAFIFSGFILNELIGNIIFILMSYMV
jgi:hypothetical protein